LKDRDHAVVLPDQSDVSRAINGFDEIAQRLGFLFCFMSAHIVNRRKRYETYAEIGYQKFEEMRHFAYTGMLVEIASREQEWLWISEYLITQRLENQFLVKEFSALHYATECTTDMLRYAEMVSSKSTSKAYLFARMKRDHIFALLESSRGSKV